MSESGSWVQRYPEVHGAGQVLSRGQGVWDKGLPDSIDDRKPGLPPRVPQREADTGWREGQLGVRDSATHPHPV